VGLGGEVRRVRRTEQRLAEAATLGVTTAVLPAGYAGGAPSGVRVHRVPTLSAAVRLLS
jgi:DNA repair protein RadA/Sms